MTKPPAVDAPTPATDTTLAAPAAAAAAIAVRSAPIAAAVRDPRREPRRGDLFRTSDGTLLRVGSASVMIGSDGVEQPSLSLDITSPKSAHTIAVLPFVTVRARVAKAEVLHRGPEVVDPWRTAVRTRESAPPYVYAPRPRGSER